MRSCVRGCIYRVNRSTIRMHYQLLPLSAVMVVEIILALVKGCIDRVC